ncbi:hypothetical protein [Micromonospora sp. NPDC005652]|uniref:hypothetical protein n=1 Tax=Micromonospora sp. NPDC005652 TaxID=3157046 RepID=UPI0034050A13
MALNPVDVMPARFWAVQYDGTNSSDLTQWTGGWVMYEGEGMLSLLIGYINVDVLVGGWLIGTAHTPCRVVDTAPPGELENVWIIQQSPGDPEEPE